MPLRLRFSSVCPLKGLFKPLFFSEMAEPGGKKAKVLVVSNVAGRFTQLFSSVTRVHSGKAGIFRTEPQLSSCTHLCMILSHAHACGVVDRDAMQVPSTRSSAWVDSSANRTKIHRHSLTDGRRCRCLLISSVETRPQGGLPRATTIRPRTCPLSLRPGSCLAGHVSVLACMPRMFLRARTPLPSLPLLHSYTHTHPTLSPPLTRPSSLSDQRVR